MKYEIIIAPVAVHGIRRLRGRDRAMVEDAIEKYLRHEPDRTSRSRIKRLRGLLRPQYRLRVGDMRVFYDVVEDQVHVVAVVMKSAADEWLQMFGVPS